MKRYFLVYVLITLAAWASLLSQELVAKVDSRFGNFIVEQLSKNLANPWGMAFLPDGTLLVTSKGGKILSWDGNKMQSFDLNLAVAVIGQGGLLDIAIHPNFDKNSWIYLTFAEAGQQGYSTALARARWTASGPREVEVIWSGQRKTNATAHFGSRLAFGPEGALYMSFGDRGESQRAQDPADFAGKIIRLTDQGKPHPGNPKIAGAAAEVFSLGHRNVQGMVYDEANSRMLLTEHGPRGGDELNILKAGANYGWPLVTFGLDYNGSIISSQSTRPGIEAPVLHWTPSIAPSGLVIYFGKAFPKWQGHIISGNLAGRELRRIILEGSRPISQESLLKGQIGRIRDLEIGPDGLIYLITDEKAGQLLVLRPL